MLEMFAGFVAGILLTYTQYARVKRLLDKAREDLTFAHQLARHRIKILYDEQEHSAALQEELFLAANPRLK